MAKERMDLLKHCFAFEFAHRKRNLLAVCEEAVRFKSLQKFAENGFEWIIQ